MHGTQGNADKGELLARGLRAAMDADSDVRARALGPIVAAGVGLDRPIDEHPKEGYAVLAPLIPVHAPWHKAVGHHRLLPRGHARRWVGTSERLKVIGARRAT